MEGRTPEEMAWSDYIADSLDNAERIREFVTMTKHGYPVPPDAPYGSDAEWEWAKELRKWMVAYRSWLTMKYGWERAPQWLRDDPRR